MASTGAATFVAISRANTIQMPAPFSECQVDIEKSSSILVQSTIAKFSAYRQSDCFDVLKLQFLFYTGR
jgi:hypothetical protein